jgi:hypothetical protein
VPAASLPNDDRLLAMLAGFGRYRKGWSAVKAGALRGFIECSDGRLYHPVIAEKALEASRKRHGQRRRTAAATAASAKRAAEKRNENNKISTRNGPVTEPVTQPVTDTKGKERKGKELKFGGGAVAPEAIAAETALIAGPLFKKFSEVFEGQMGRGAKAKFAVLLRDGSDADAIIEAARFAGPAADAEQWLDARGWERKKLKEVAPASMISPEATALANELAKVAGQDLEFLEPGWCGAAYRVQQWLSQGWPRELIVAGVTSMVNGKRGESINTVAYFEKGLARFIAQQTKPLPEIVNIPAEKVEAYRGSTHHQDARSGIAAIDRVYAKIEAAEMQRGGGEALPEIAVHLLPSRSVPRS